VGLSRRDPISREVPLDNNRLSSSDQDFLDNSVHQDPVEDLDSWDQDLPVDQGADHLDLEDPEWDLEVLEWVLEDQAWDQEVLEWGLNDLVDLVDLDLAAHVETDLEDLQVAVPTRE
jgi:hypothetical protein